MTLVQGIAALAIVSAAGAPSLAAQIDYRNLDDHRPVGTEDAYSIERYAFELLIPYEFEDGPGGELLHAFTPELSHGVLANAQIGVKLPFAALDAAEGTDWGLAGPRLFALYNLNTETRSLPALAVRTDLGLPVGGLAGDDVQLSVKGIATRSWGLTRLHLNGSFSLGDPSRGPAADAEPDWAVSLAADRTFLRQSLLLLGELGVNQRASSAPAEITAGLGVRYQLTPTLVLDGGVGRRLSARVGPDLRLTVGLSHAFAIAGLLPAGSR